MASLEQDAAARADKAHEYVERTWALWHAEHARTISAWYQAFVVPEPEVASQKLKWTTQ